MTENIPLLDTKLIQKAESLFISDLYNSLLVCLLKEEIYVSHYGKMFILIPDMFYVHKYMYIRNK